MANDGIFLALGGLLLLSIFRRPGAGAPVNGGQVGSLYGGGVIGDFAADATLRADEASGVGKGYLLVDPFLFLKNGGSGPDGLITKDLTEVATLEVGPLGGYVKSKEKLPPKVSRPDEDIGISPFGFLDIGSLPKEIAIGPSSVPVIEQKPQILGPGPLVPSIPEILGPGPLEPPVPVLLGYGAAPGTFQLTLDRPITTETPLRLTQVVNPDTGIITKAGFGPKGRQGFTAQNIGVLQAAMAGYGNINEYRAAVAAGEV